MLNSPLKITFCGHSRFANQEEIFQELVQTLDQFFVLAIEKDIAIEFYCGGYGTFDHMSSKAIQQPLNIEFFLPVHNHIHFQVLFLPSLLFQP